MVRVGARFRNRRLFTYGSANAVIRGRRGRPPDREDDGRKSVRLATYMRTTRNSHIVLKLEEISWPGRIACIGA